ncbi:phospholipase C [Malassezia nana]|uniref:Phospholipase C n=1 Tax=Malassezia nana TaxID=180528 RepID=A0AAF0J546_9BASI|nr:phospholipase C [Malassezia nana]
MVRLTAVAAAASVALTLSPAFAAYDELKKVKHIVLFMQENRAFDHYFGTMAGVRGFQDPNVHISSNTGKDVFHQPVNRTMSDLDSKVKPDYYPPKNVTELLPWHITYQGGDYVNRTQCMVAGTNDWRQNHAAWNNGEIDRWAMNNTPYSLGYYRREDIETQYALAGNFTIADSYYESVISSTDPNRASWFSGTINVNGSVVGGGGPKLGGPVIDNNVDPRCLKADDGSLFSCRPLKWKTVPEYLYESNISFQVYQDKDNFGDDTLVEWEQYQKASKHKTQLAKQSTSYPGLHRFVEDAMNGTLPEVSYIIAPMQLSEHPPYTPLDGAWIQTLVANAVMKGKGWNSTVLFYSFDETGGWADHVMAPHPPTNASGEWMIDPYDKSLGKVPTGPGFRVPFYAVSPWSRNGGVFTEHAAHESQILFLEEWAKAVGKPFHTKEMNPWRRHQLSNLVSMLDFSHEDTSVLDLPFVPKASKDPITNKYNGADVCSFKFGDNVQPKVPYGKFNEEESLRVEQGYKPVRGDITEGRYLTFEVGQKALSHKGDKLSSTQAQKNHDAPEQRFIVHWQGTQPKDQRFLISTASKNNRRYLTESLALDSNKNNAAEFSIVDLRNGKGHAIINAKTQKQISMDEQGQVSVKGEADSGFQVYSVTF